MKSGGMMMSRHFRDLCILLVASLILTGCQTSYDASVAVSSNGTVTGTVTVHIQPTQQAQTISTSDFETAASSNYQIVLQVPSSNFALTSSTAVQTTLTATTDNGSTSSIVVTLQPSSVSPSTTHSGYTAYTFTVQDSSQLGSWIQQTEAQANATLNLSATTDAAFTDLGNPGTYTFYAQISSTQTGTVDAGSATYTRVSPPSGGTCTSRVCQNQ